MQKIQGIRLGNNIQNKIYNAQFMTSSLPTLADNLTERLHRDECQDCMSSLEHIIFQKIHANI